MSIGTGFALLHNACAFTRYAIAHSRANDPDNVERYKRKARDHLRLVAWQPSPRLPDSGRTE